MTRDGDNDGLARDLGRDERAGLFERIGVDGEKRLAVLDDGEGLAWFAFGLLRLVLELENSHHRACSKTKYAVGNSISPPTVVCSARFPRYL